MVWKVYDNRKNRSQDRIRQALDWQMKTWKTFKNRFLAAGKKSSEVIDSHFKIEYSKICEEHFECASL